MNTPRQIKSIKTLLGAVLLSAIGLTSVLFYSGFFSSLPIQEINIQPIPIKGQIIKGSYANTYKAMRDLDPSIDDVILIFIDNPNLVPSPNLTSIVGLQTSNQNPEIIITLPTLNAISLTFPNTTRLSPITGLFRAYPKLNAYLKSHNLEKNWAIERHTSHNIQYIIPISPNECPTVNLLN